MTKHDKRPTHIVLDLDATVVHTIPSCQCTNHECIRVYHELCYVHLRPSTKEFISKCYDMKYEFIVFSANEDEYVKKVSEYVFRDLKPPKMLLSLKNMILVKPSYQYLKTLSLVSHELNVSNDELVAIDDNEDMYPDDTGNVIRIIPWHLTQVSDTELMLIFNEKLNF